MEAQMATTRGSTAGERLKGKVAVVIGAGQSPGEGVGNGRAAAIRFAREGARVVAVDRNLESAEETASLIVAEGFECFAASADVTREEDLARVMKEAVQRWGSLDVLHNNVGVSIAGGDRDLMEITEEGPDGHCKLPHLWSAKFPQAGRADYESAFSGTASLVAASLRR